MIKIILALTLAAVVTIAFVAAHSPQNEGYQTPPVRLIAGPQNDGGYGHTPQGGGYDSTGPGSGTPYQGPVNSGSYAR